MDLQKLTIGQMAELNHISEQTLRLYDRVGLLKPRYIDRATGYRYYHESQLPAACRITARTSRSSSRRSCARMHTAGCWTDSGRSKSRERKMRKK